ncbi:MAG TPA: alpha/beta fold hydrolase, partial [Solirubrobacteraceae bacterium]|nr:alpha/beta fold hydrolase [Solirubrobacteraceae bacterium]
MAARNEVMIDSDGSVLAAWAYVSAPKRPCVVMAHGFSLTRHDGLEAYAERLADAGLSVLVFDHRYLGDSGGEPRQRFRAAEQLQDWRAAIAFARSLPAVDPAKIIPWGFSFSGGHVVTLAAEDPSFAAAIALCPFVNGLRRVLGAKPRDIAWLLPRAIADLAGRPNLVPVTAPPGSHAAMTLPGEAEGFAAVVPPGSSWRDEISPGVFATVALHR